MSEQLTRTFSEDEAYAIAADRVAAETAKLQAEKDDLSAQLEDVTSQLEVASAKLATTEAELASARQEFADFKAELEAAKEKAEIASARVSAYKEAVPALPDDFYTAERASRWAEMSEDVFADMLATVTASVTTTHVETAMAGVDVAPVTNESAAAAFLRGIKE